MIKAFGLPAGAAAAGLVLASMAVGCSTESDATRGIEAESVCKDFVKDRLKSPGSAKFHTDNTGSGTAFTVTGTVDSQNSFGALIRNNFTCRVHEVGDRWFLDDLTGLEN